MLEYTDEYILSLKTVSVNVAAKYLGKPNTFVYWGLQDGVLPIGTAVKQAKQWTYDIRPQLLYNYKHGIRQAPDQLLCEMAETMREVVEQAAQVCKTLAALQGTKNEEEEAAASGRCSGAAGH